MFRAKANGNEFLVRFRHVDYGVDFLRRIGRLRKDFNANGHQVLRCTECSIYNAAGVVISQGMAICSPLDRFEKRAGCKLAMTDAIRHSRERAKQTITNHPPISRTVAEQLWKTLLANQSRQTHATASEGA